MVANELSALVETIAEGIAIRGIYLLMDERLDLVCGPGTLQHRDNPEVTQTIAEFGCSRVVGHSLPSGLRFDLIQIRLAYPMPWSLMLTQ